MTALERLNAIAATRPLTHEECDRLSYLVKRAARTPEQRERDRAKRRETYKRQARQINAEKRAKYAKDFAHAERLRFRNRVAYRRRAAATA